MRFLREILDPEHTQINNLEDIEDIFAVKKKTVMNLTASFRKNFKGKDHKEFNEGLEYGYSKSENQQIVAAVNLIEKLKKETRENYLRFQFAYSNANRIRPDLSVTDEIEDKVKSMNVLIATYWQLMAQNNNIPNDKIKKIEEKIDAYFKVIVDDKSKALEKIAGEQQRLGEHQHDPHNQALLKDAVINFNATHQETAKDTAEMVKLIKNNWRYKIYSGLSGEAWMPKFVKRLLVGKELDLLAEINNFQQQIDIDHKRLKDEKRYVLYGDQAAQINRAKNRVELLVDKAEDDYRAFMEQKQNSSSIANTMEETLEDMVERSAKPMGPVEKKFAAITNLINEYREAGNKDYVQLQNIMKIMRRKDAKALEALEGYVINTDHMNLTKDVKFNAVLGKIMKILNIPQSIHSVKKTVDSYIGSKNSWMNMPLTRRKLKRAKEIKEFLDNDDIDGLKDHLKVIQEAADKQGLFKGKDSDFKKVFDNVNTYVGLVFKARDEDQTENVEGYENDI